MMTHSMNIFRVGNKAIVLEEVSHWWVNANGADSSFAELVVTMRSGRQVTFLRQDAPNGDDAYAIETGLMNTLMNCASR
jgi:hypothetical protein